MNIQITLNCCVTPRIVGSAVGLMMTVVLLALVVIPFSSSSAQDKKEQGINVLRIEVGKNGSVGVYDMNGNLVVSRPDASSRAMPDPKNKTERLLASDTLIEKGSSPSIQGSPQSPQMKLFQNQKPVLDSLNEKGSSPSIQGSPQSPQMKLFQNQKPVLDMPPEKGFSTPIQSSPQNPQMKLFRKSAPETLNERGSSLSIQGSPQSPQMKLFQNQKPVLDAPDEKGSSTPIQGSPQSPPMRLFQNQKPVMDTPDEKGFATPIQGSPQSPPMKLFQETFGETLHEKGISSSSLAAPNLTLYTGTGSNNTYSYSASTHVLTVNSSVQNNGTADAGAFRDGWYLSTNTTISTSDYLVMTATHSSLAYGYYSNKSGNINLDNVSGLPAGIYYVGVIFDDLSEVSESSETDNTAYYTPTINYTGGPNLTLYSGTGSNNSYSYSSSTKVLGVNNSVQNNGGADAGAFRVGWYLSTNTTITTSDYLVTTATHSSLSYGYYANKSGSINLDNVSLLPSGTYYVGVYFDDLLQVNESDETDNSAYFLSTMAYTGGPNLTLYTGTGSNNTYSYTSSTHVLAVNSSVQNSGGVDAGAFRVGWYLSTNTTITTADYLVTTATHSSLAYGYYANKSSSMNLDNVSGLPVGTYYVGVYFDDLSQVSELNESDNTVYFTPTMAYTGAPNLTLYTGTGSNNTYSYTSSTHVLAVNASALNNGTADAGAFRVGWYLSTNTTISTADYLVATATVNSLSYGYYVNKSGLINLDNVSLLPSGGYYVGVYFDDLSQVNELDETDNTAYYTPAIAYTGAPNLTLYTGTGSNNTYGYTSSTHVLVVNASVQNNGGVDAGGFRVGWYLSTNTTITTADYLVTTASHSSLSYGYYTNKSGSINLDNVSGLPGGTYYVGVFFDDLSQVSELDETDNTAYYTPTLGYTGAPNLTLFTGTGSNNTYTYSGSTHVLSVNASVQNNGTGDAGAFRVGWYLSTNTTISTADYLVATASHTSLPYGYYVIKSSSINLDNVSGLPSGTYYVGVFFDDLSQVSELDETDNTAYYTPTIAYTGAPNLTLYTGTGSNNSFSYLGATHVLAVNASVQNNGTADAGAFRVGWYLSTNNIISTSDYLVTSASQSSCSCGYYVNKSSSINLDNVRTLPSGTYYVGVIFDDLSQINELDETDNAAYYAPNTISIITSVEEISSGIPNQYELCQNYPNPFNPVTTIEFSIPKSTFVTLKIYDALGIHLETLVDQNLAAGRYRLRWGGPSVASGVYFCQIQSGEFTATKKLVLLR